MMAVFRQRFQLTKGHLNHAEQRTLTFSLNTIHWWRLVQIFIERVYSLAWRGKYPTSTMAYDRRAEILYSLFSLMFVIYFLYLALTRSQLITVNLLFQANKLFTSFPGHGMQITHVRPLDFSTRSSIIQAHSIYVSDGFSLTDCLYIFISTVRSTNTLNY